mmetsp:Transcript_22445/g.64460  ORF Transcript_22445/g.64460 Transcript_22445/m.64460 type:complete len:234 (+) Transcript_22445:3465-4166(+)
MAKVFHRMISSIPTKTLAKNRTIWMRSNLCSRRIMLPPLEMRHLVQPMKRSRPKRTAVRKARWHRRRAVISRVPSPPLRVRPIHPGAKGHRLLLLSGFTNIKRAIRRRMLRLILMVKRTSASQRRGKNSTRRAEASQRHASFCQVARSRGLLNGKKSSRLKLTPSRPRMMMAWLPETPGPPPPPGTTKATTPFKIPRRALPRARTAAARRWKKGRTRRIPLLAVPELRLRGSV